MFLDANILFSAALDGPSFDLLWRLRAAGRVTLVTSVGCVAEARVNLERKRPAALPRLLARLSDVEASPGIELPGARSAALLPRDDAVVLDSALAARCAVLVTGDVRHFGRLMSPSRADPDADPGLRVTTLREFLLAGP